MAALEISRPDARRSALRGLIDYAGLFPPASLEMKTAVADYRAAQASREAWIVDRFICPAARLEDFVAVLAPTMTAGEEPWRLAVTTGPGWTESLTPDAGAARTFADTVGSAASIELVEIGVPSEIATDPRILAADVGEVLRAFEAMVLFEIPWDADPSGPFDVLRSVRQETGRAVGVKIRCGGLTAALFPEPHEVARFVAAAGHRALPMKATAGLHHPFRHTDPATNFTHHGFVNLLMAAALASQGADEPVLSEVLADADANSFSIERGGLGWRDRKISADALDAVRSNVFIGYGSCSFDEPVRDLAELGVLPV